jgi:Trypsin-like peptidase domain
VAVLTELFLNAFRLHAEVNGVGLGTAFFIEYLIESGSSSPNTIIFGVTAKHVIDQQKSVSFELNRRSESELPLFGDSKWLTVTKEKFIEHPDGFDLAVFACGEPINELIQSGFHPFLKVWYADGLGIAYERDFETLEIGRTVYCAGFPDGKGDNKLKVPLVRTGTIAFPPYLPFSFGQDSNEVKNESLVLDLWAYPGSSGSPLVVTQLGGSSIMGQNDQTATLIGIVTEVILDRVDAEMGLTRAVRASRLRQFAPLIEEVFKVKIIKRNLRF